MTTNSQLTKWGNSLAVRIPKAVAIQAGFLEGDRIELSTQEDGQLILRRALGRKITLEELVARIDPDNRHGETDWGPPVRREVW